MSVELTETAKFTCNATGYKVAYKWTARRHLSSKVIGTYTNTLVIPDVRSTDSKKYQCVVSNKGGTVYSKRCRLTVMGMAMMLLGDIINFLIDGTGLPDVTVIPSSQSVEVTHTAIFNTTVSGVGVKNFIYQWRHNGTVITGETGKLLMITNVMQSDGGDYECIVTNQYGDSGTSAIAVLKITSEHFIKHCIILLNGVLGIPPVIVVHPEDVIEYLLNNATLVRLTCKADGAVTYYWERQIGIIPTGSIGANTNTLTIINLQLEDAGNYRCVATNASGSSVSDYAQLSINGQLYICTSINF